LRRSSGTSSFLIERAPGKIDGLFAAFAYVLFVKFVRKDLERFSAFRALAGYGSQVLVSFKTGTMHRRTHERLLFLSIEEFFGETASWTPYYNYNVPCRSRQ